MHGRMQLPMQQLRHEHMAQLKCDLRSQRMPRRYAHATFPRNNNCGVCRESFAKYFTMTEIEKNEVKWTPTDAGALLDVDALQQHYAKKGEQARSGRW